MAIEGFNKNPIFFTSALAWVYIDLAKEAINNTNWSKADEWINKILALPLQPDAILSSQLCWLIVKNIWKGRSSEAMNQAYLMKLIKWAKPIDEKTTDALISAALQVNYTFKSLSLFLVWVEITKIKDSENIEKWIIKIAKTILKNEESIKDTIQYLNVLVWIKDVCNHKPELIYVKYYLIKLFIKDGEKEEALKLVRPFVREKCNEFWAWQLLANCVEGEEKLTFYSKALSLGGKNEMLIGLRQEMAGLLIQQSKWNEAKHEIQQIINVRNTQSWNVPGQLIIWQQQPEYIKAIALKLDYSKTAQLASSWLNNDLLKVEIIITNVDSPLKLANYYDAEGNGGKFKYKNMINSQPRIGQVFSATIVHDNEKGYNKIIAIEANNQPFNWVKPFEECLRKLEKGFGFVGDIYLSAKIIEQKGYVNGQKISGMAMQMMDLAKQKPGWRAIILK